MTDTNLVPTTPTTIATTDALAEEARGYLSASRSPATLRAYASDWRAFTAWCDVHHVTALPAEPTTVILYLTDLARSMKTATIRRRMSSISVVHQAAGYESPTADLLVRSAWSGIRRTNGVAQSTHTLLTDDIRKMVETLPNVLIGTRDRCLLLLGFASTLRRSELVALDIVDVVETNDGLVVSVRRSKTDQEGEGREIGIPYGSNPSTCPVRAWRAWVESAQIEEGALFRPIDRHERLGAGRLSDRSVALVVKRAAGRDAGIDPQLVAGHSLRSGMATSAARAGASEAQIMNQTGHKSLPVLRRYIRRGSLFNENAAARLGL